jgi:hypothetical protein
MDIDGDEEFTVAHAALGRDDGAGAGCEPHVRRAWLAPLRHAIWIAREDGSPELLLAERHCGLRIADCGFIFDRRFDVFGDPLDVCRDIAPLVDRLQQIG